MGNEHHARKSAGKECGECVSLLVVVCVCVYECVWYVCISVCALFPPTLPCWEWEGDRRESKMTTENEAAHLGREAMSLPYKPDADFNQFNQWAMFAGCKNSPEVAGQRL